MQRLWTDIIIIVVCFVSALEGVQRRALARAALHLQCRPGHVIQVDGARLATGDSSHRQQEGSEALAVTCQRLLSEGDDDFRLLVQLCSGQGSCSGIVAPRNVSMAPCWRSFGIESSDFMEVNYTCVDKSLVTNICSSASRGLYAGYVQSPSYPAAPTQFAEALLRAPGHVRCSCLLTAENHASIELMLLDVDAEASLEIKPQYADPSRPCQPAACLNRYHQTSYSRLNVTFTLKVAAGSSVGAVSTSGHFFLRYSASQGPARVQSSCQLLDSGVGVLSTANKSHDEAELGFSRTSNDSSLNDTTHLTVTIGVAVPVLILAVIIIVVCALKLHLRGKHWMMKRDVLPCCWTSHASVQGSQSAFRAKCTKACSGGDDYRAQHTYDIAASSPWHSDCEDGHYDTIPGHHYHEIDERRHYETVFDDVAEASPLQAIATEGSGDSEESGWCGMPHLVAVATGKGSIASPHTTSSSASTIYEALGGQEEAMSGGSVASLDIDFSDIVAESLRRMSEPVTRPTSDFSIEQWPSDTAPRPCEDYMRPLCTHTASDLCCRVSPIGATCENKMPAEDMRAASLVV